MDMSSDGYTANMEDTAVMLKMTCIDGREAVIGQPAVWIELAASAGISRPDDVTLAADCVHSDHADGDDAAVCTAIAALCTLSTANVVSGRISSACRCPLVVGLDMSALSGDAMLSGRTLHSVTRYGQLLASHQGRLVVVARGMQARQLSCCENITVSCNPGQAYALWQDRARHVRQMAEQQAGGYHYRPGELAGSWLVPVEMLRRSVIGRIDPRILDVQTKAMSEAAADVSCPAS